LHHLRRELLLSRFGGEIVGRFSDSEKAELWVRFEAGESLRLISRQLGRAPSSVRTHVVAAGWRRPVPAGDWCPIRLSFGERKEISRGLAGGESLRCIARRLGRSASTVSREVAGNGGRPTGGTPAPMSPVGGAATDEQNRCHPESLESSLSR
jgi:DNA-binding CsgD family transcriptional regulator